LRCRGDEAGDYGFSRAVFPHGKSSRAITALLGSSSVQCWEIAELTLHDARIRYLASVHARGAAVFSQPGGLLGEVGVAMIVPMMVMAVHNHDDLALRRVGDCEAEEKY
jgi:hypothetical protein